MEGVWGAERPRPALRQNVLARRAGRPVAGPPFMEGVWGAEQPRPATRQKVLARRAGRPVAGPPFIGRSRIDRARYRTNDPAIDAEIEKLVAAIGGQDDELVTQMLVTVAKLVRDGAPRG